MNREDFYKLRIEQKIYRNGEEKVIDAIIAHSNEKMLISFVGDNNYSTFTSIMHELSFEKPKQKQKYYLWTYTDVIGRVRIVDCMHTKDFEQSTGVINKLLRDMPDDKKKCHEDIFIEV